MEIRVLKIWTDKESASRDCVQIARHDVPCHGKRFAEYKKKKRHVICTLIEIMNEWRESNPTVSLQIFSRNHLVFWPNSWTNSELCSFLIYLGIFAVQCIIV